MVKNLTFEELSRVRELGAKAEEVGKVAEENGLRFLFDFSYGITRGTVVVKLECEEIKTEVIKAVTTNLFEEGEYEKINNALDEAMCKAANSCKNDRLAYYEQKIADLKKGENE